jgi:hypothetical protein
MPRPKQPERVENSLLGDLESIRQLLATGSAGVAATSAGSEEPPDVPMLDDVIGGGLEVDEAPLASRGAFGEPDNTGSTLADDTIEALLGDRWRESADRIIRSAREALTAASAQWTATESDELHAALRDRIDEALDDWMDEVTHGKLDELRRRLLAAIEHEVVRIGRSLTQGED